MKKAVLISCFGWYKARLKPIRELLIGRGYNVTVLMADFDHIKKQSISYRYPECTYIPVPQYKKNISIQRVWSHLSFGKQCKKIIDEQKPDIVYCMVPPNKVADYCAFYRKTNPESKLILDIIDLWPESMPMRKLNNTLPVRAWKKWRDDAIKIADHVFTECDFYKDKLGEIIEPVKTSTLYLFKEQTEKEKELIRKITYKRSQDNVIRFAYLGSMNNIIDIDGICAVIKSFVESGKTCELHAIGDGESREKFECLVRDVGCKGYFYGLVFDEIEKIKILTPCNYAFNMMRSDVSVGLTIKSIDYLSYGLPLINNIKGDTWKLVEDNKIGVNVGDTFTVNDVFREIDKTNIITCFDEKMSKQVFIAKVSNILL